MILELKKVFLVENESVKLETEVDMSPVGEQAAAFTGPVAAEICVHNHAGLVELEAEVSFEYQFDCDRCAKTVNRKFAYEFRHILVLQLSEDNGDDYIEAPDYKLDIDALLRDDILLELPSKLLCKEDCKGLCIKCGKNLNDGSCSCETQETDPRMAILKQLLQS